MKNSHFKKLEKSFHLFFFRIKILSTQMQPKAKRKIALPCHFPKKALQLLRKGQKKKSNPLSSRFHEKTT